MPVLCGLKFQHRFQQFLSAALLLAVVSIFIHFQPLQVMNESECFNKLVDPVPETYIGLEPDGLYKECRQVNEKSDRSEGI